MKIGRRLNYSYYRHLLLSFISLSVMLTVVITLSIYIPLAKNYRHEIERFSRSNLNYIRDTISNTVLQQADTHFFSLTGAGQFSSDVTYFFDHSIAESKIGVNNVSQILINQVINQKEPILKNISVYYREEQCLISSSYGIRYLGGKAREIYSELDWLQNNNETESTDSWIATRPVRVVPESTSSGEQDLYSYVRPYPWGVGMSEASGLFCFDFTPDFFRDTVWPMASASSNLFLVTRQGRLISSRLIKDDKIGFDHLDFISEITSSTEERSLIREVNNKSYIINTATFPNNSWTLISMTSQERYQSQITGIRNRTLASGMVLSVLGLLLSHYFALKIYNPVGEIIKGINNQVDDERGAISPDRNELSYISSYIDAINREMSQLKNDLKEYLPILKSTLIRDLLTNSSRGIDEHSKKPAYLNFTFANPLFNALIINSEGKETSDDYRVLLYSKFKLLNHLENCRAGGVDFMGTHLSENRIAVIVNHSMERDELIRIIGDLLEDNFSSEPFSFHAALGRSYDSPDSLHFSFAEADILCRYRFFSPGESLLTDEEYLDSKGDSPCLEECQKVLLAKGVKDREAVLERVEMITSLVLGKRCALSYGKMLLSSLVCETAAYSRRLGYSGYAKRDLFAEFIEQGDINSVREWIASVMSDLQDYGKTTRLNISQEHIRRCREYIADHLSSELSLTIVSDAVKLNTVYLSRIFKQEMGMNFSEYVNTLRLEKSRDLLLSTREPVNIIADSSGFGSTTYFNKKFKEKYGTSPGVYRRAGRLF